MDKNTYKSAGVDKEAGYASVQKISKFVKETYTPYVLGDLGGFGGSVELPSGYAHPVMVSGTDGVGTKLLIAQLMDKHDTVGQDLVAMCVNDILCNGAKPLYFLDYIACGKNDPNKIEQIVKGVATGCILADCALVGGETAEMPGMYDADEYDLAGFASGIVEKEKFITGQNISDGDILIGLKSSGLHSNGFSLVRKICFDIKKYDVDQYIDEFDKTLGEVLLTPTEIYVKDILALLEVIEVQGMSHITGGGFIENIPRMIPEGLKAIVDLKQIKHTLPIFDFIQKEGSIDIEEMYSTFNMGIGFVIAIRKKDSDTAIEILQKFDHDPMIIGHIVKGEGKIELCH